MVPRWTQRERKRARAVLFDGGRALNRSVSTGQLGDTHVTYIVIQIQRQVQNENGLLGLGINWPERRSLVDLTRKKTFSVFSQPYEYMPRRWETRDSVCGKA